MDGTYGDPLDVIAAITPVAGLPADRCVDRDDVARSSS
jgi:hypothetical protein